jgi:hypothetical protein
MAKKFKAHMMYKGKKSVMAKTMADHLRLKKQGYGHTAPKYDDGGKVDEKKKSVSTPTPKLNWSEEDYAKAKEDYEAFEEAEIQESKELFEKQMKNKATGALKMQDPIFETLIGAGLGRAAMKAGSKPLGYVLDKGYDAAKQLSKSKKLKAAALAWELGTQDVIPMGKDKKEYKAGGKVEDGFEGYTEIASSASSNAIAAKKAAHHGKHPNAKYKFTTDKEGNTHMYAKFDKGGKMPNVKPDNREDLIIRYKKGGKAKSTVNSAGNYTMPSMRKRLFNRIKAGTKGGRAGQWSARKAQLLAKLYKKNGGGYR